MALTLEEQSRRRQRRLRRWGLAIGVVAGILSALIGVLALMVGAALSGRSPALNAAGMVFVVLLVAAICGVFYAFVNPTGGGVTTLIAACGLAIMAVLTSGAVLLPAGPFVVAGILLIQAGMADRPPEGGSGYDGR